MMDDFLKPPKEYKFTILSNSIAKKKFVYRNKDKFPKYLRLDISNPNVIIMDYDQIEVPIEGAVVVRLRFHARENTSASLKFIRYDTDEVEEELIFHVSVR
ncbi:hypothetical protein pb186bvf_000140 [Paramecium bursaria]